jgi:hypothetical protein
MNEPCATGCAPGFFCNSGTCAAQLGAGAGCTQNIECQKGLFCDTGSTTPACTVPKDPGQACDGPQSCKNGDCLAGTCNGVAGTSCFTDAQCGNRCSNTGNFCTSNCSFSGFGCGFSHCSLAVTTACCANTDCGSAGGTCGALPGTCGPTTCTGDIVCANLESTIDYCLAGQQTLAQALAGM